MPWTPADAPSHTKLATTDELRRLWARIANDELRQHGDEARAIRVADATVKRAADRQRSRSRFV